MAGRMNFRALFSIVSGVILCAACASAARPAMAPLPPQAADNAAMKGEIAIAPAAAPMAPAPESAAPQAPGQSLEEKGGGKRMVIKNVDLSIVVEDPVKSMNEIGRLSEEMGGFVVVSNVYQTKTESGVDVPQGSITVRVPAEKLNLALEKIKAGAVEVQRENVSGQDVTQEYTDLKSRLRNLEAAETDLRKIMDAAYSTEDVMNVYNQLVQIREQIEVVKGQIQYYETSASLSAVKVDLIAKASIEPLSVGGWQPAGEARDAVQALINAFKFLINFSIWILLFFVPLLIVIAIPIWLVIWLIRRIYRNQKAAKVANAAKSAQAVTEVVVPDESEQPEKDKKG